MEEIIIGPVDPAAVSEELEKRLAELVETLRRLEEAKVVSPEVMQLEVMI